MSLCHTLLPVKSFMPFLIIDLLFSDSVTSYIKHHKEKFHKSLKMKKYNLFKQMKHRHQECYNISVISVSRDIQNSVTTCQIESKESCTKCRYIVTLIGFGVFMFLNIHRMNMTVSIVDMVNNTALPNQNTTSDSCPLPNAANSTSISDKASKGEFSWTPETQGYILGSSFFGYFFTQFIAGKMSEIFGAKWILFWGMLVASVSTLVTPYTSWWNVYALIASQTLRGMAQGVYQSALSVLIANWFPKFERGSLSTIMMSGQCVGALAGGLLSGILCQSSLLGGWPSVFYIFGLAGVIFSVLIAIFLHENPGVHPSISKNELKFILSNQENTLSQKRPSTPWLKMFTSTPIYALAVAFFGQFWAATHFIAVHPTFLGTILHFSIEQNGFFTSVPFIVQTVLTLSASSISAFLNKRNLFSIDKVRKFWNTMACLGYSICLVGIYFAQCNRTWSIVFSILSMGCVGFALAGCMIVPPDMSPTFAGSVMGFSCTLGTTASFILPVVVGFLTNGLQTIEQWNKIIFISIGVVMTSGVIFIIYGSAEVQEWNYVDERRTEEKKNSPVDQYELQDVHI